MLYTSYKEIVKNTFADDKSMLIEGGTPMEPGGIVLLVLIAALAIAAVTSSKKNKQKQDPQE